MSFGDLLHPLASLCWEEEGSPLPKGGIYPQCFILKNRLYVATTYKYSMTNTVHNLHASSDLKSWTPLKVPTELFGIGVYDSHLVLAGGKEIATRKVTAKVWTISENGLEWSASVLPPLLSPRSLPSLASAGDPECLIVAGGTDPHNRIRNVEVLMCKSQWVKVESLPVPCCKMQSLVWCGNVYFGLKGDPGREQSSVLFCNFKSLLSTSSAHSSSGIWKELKTPVKEPSPCIFMDHLIVLGGTFFKTDPCSRLSQQVCAFSPDTQAWVHIGDMPCGMSYPAMIAWGSGKHLLVLGEEDVSKQWKTLRGSLAFSEFKPNSSFCLSALSKLEDAGIEILSILTNVHQKFTELLGITLDQHIQAEYDASEGRECVEIAVRQWLKGHSTLSPTWQAFFAVLRQLDLMELQQDIQEFLTSAKCLKEICYCAVLSALLEHQSENPGVLCGQLPPYVPPTLKHTITNRLKTCTHEILHCS